MWAGLVRGNEGVLGVIEGVGVCLAQRKIGFWPDDISAPLHVRITFAPRTWVQSERGGYAGHRGHC